MPETEIKRVLTPEDFPPVRSMTRRERKALLASGLDPTQIGVKAQGEGVDQLELINLSECMVDHILATAYPNYDFSDAPNDLCMAFATNTYQASVGIKQEHEKNS